MEKEFNVEEVEKDLDITTGNPDAEGYDAGLFRPEHQIVPGTRLGPLHDKSFAGKERVTGYSGGCSFPSVDLLD